MNLFSAIIIDDSEHDAMIVYDGKNMAVESAWGSRAQHLEKKLPVVSFESKPLLTKSQGVKKKERLS